MNHFFLRALILPVFFLGNHAQADFVVPRLTGPVVDEAGVLSTGKRKDIEFYLRQLRDQGGPQINVVTIKTLNGVSIEDAGIKMAEAWGLGGKKRDDGIILLVSMAEKKIRIEVGQGLEGRLTDLESSRIIDDQMVPYFRQGDPQAGITAGVNGILAKVSSGGVSAAVPHSQLKKREPSLWEYFFRLLFPVLFIVLQIYTVRRRFKNPRRYDTMRSRGGWTSGGGGWSGGGGFSSGGWSGGGGGFSGGGASGGW